MDMMSENVGLCSIYCSQCSADYRSPVVETNDLWFKDSCSGIWLKECYG